jgi:hypothetical protein
MPLPYPPVSDYPILPDKRYVYCGWEFGWEWILEPARALPEHRLVMVSRHRLEHPEAPNLVYGYWIGPSIPDDIRDQLVCRDLDYLKREGAAWLMAHWWEHRLQVCPCQNGEDRKVGEPGQETNFHRAFITTVMRLTL